MTLPYVSRSPTSKAAAQVAFTSADSVREQVYELIAQSGVRGCTDDGVEVALGLRHQTASARRRELVLEGRVIDNGQVRPTRSGCSATVWVANGTNRNFFRPIGVAVHNKKVGGRSVQSNFQITSFTGALKLGPVEVTVVYDENTKTLTFKSLPLGIARRVVDSLAGMFNAVPVPDSAVAALASRVRDGVRARVSSPATPTAVEEPPSAVSSADEPPSEPEADLPAAASDEPEEAPSSDDGVDEAPPSPPPVETRETVPRRPVGRPRGPSVPRSPRVPRQPPPPPPPPPFAPEDDEATEPEADESQESEQEPADESDPTPGFATDEEQMLAEMKSAPHLAGVMRIIQAHGVSGVDAIMGVINKYRSQVPVLARAAGLESRVRRHAATGG